MKYNNVYRMRACDETGPFTREARIRALECESARLVQKQKQLYSEGFDTGRLVRATEEKLKALRLGKRFEAADGTVIYMIEEG